MTVIAELQDALEHARAQFDSIVNQNVDGILVVDENGAVCYANPAAADLLQRPVASLFGEQFGLPFIADEIVELDLLRPHQPPLVAEMRVAQVTWEGAPASLVLLRDVTMRHQAERDMRFQGQLLEAVEQSVIATRVDGTIIYWNRYASVLHTMAREDVLGRNIADVILTDKSRATLPEIQARIRQGESWVGELWVRRHDDTVFLEQLTISPLRDNYGVITGMVGVAHDITERRVMEAHLAWESGVNAAVADLAEVLLSTPALDDITYIVLQHAQRLTESAFGFVGYIDQETGYLVAPTMTRDIWDECQIHEKSAVFEKFGGLWGWVLDHRESLLTNSPGTDPRSSGVPAGHIPIHNFVAAPALIGDTLVGTVALANASRDYTARDLALVQRMASLYALAVQRERTNQALRASEDRHRTLFETMTQGVVYYKPEGQIIEANPAAERILGVPMETLLQRTFDAPEWRVKYETRPASDEPHPTTRRLLEDGEIQDVVVGVYNPQQRDYVWLNVSAVPLYNEGETHPYQINTTFTDITQRKRMEAQLREYTERLEQLVNEKVHELEDARAKVIHAGRMASLGEMATGVAHELNQPLTAMLFDIDYLKTMAERAEAQEDITLDLSEVCQIAHDLSQDIDRCRHIINHLRDFGRVSATLPEAIDLNLPLNNAFILTGERLRLHDVHIERDLAPDLPPVMGNVHKLEQVFLNLISNAEYALREMAEKHSDFKKVLRVVTYTNGERVIAEVRDNGPGIPAIHHEQLFDPFFTTKPIGEGTGLGLSISYGIVAEFGGMLTFESTVGQGTCFRASFPIHRPEARAA